MDSTEKDKWWTKQYAEELEKRDIHTFFELTYAQYLAIPRSVLQSMPEEWQHKFVELLDELWDKDWFSLLPKNTTYKVELREEKYNLNGEFKWGKQVDDPLANYERGRRKVF